MFTLLSLETCIILAVSRYSDIFLNKTQPSHNDIEACGNMSDWLGG